MSETAALPPKGIDWAFQPPKISSLASNGVKFVVRYTSPGSNPKNLTGAEKTALLAAGMHVCLVFESTAGRMRSGHAGGVYDAGVADAEVKALGMGGLPVYFAADWDVQPGELFECDAYLDGCASVIGVKRTGVYGGLRIVKHALDNRRVTFAWQTYAWSGGVWDSRAQLRQVRNGVPMGGGTVDIDEARAADYGQWPRPAAAPKPLPSGIYHADGHTSLRQLATRQGVGVPAIWWATVAAQVTAGSDRFGDLQWHYLNASDWQAVMPSGMILWLP